MDDSERRPRPRPPRGSEHGAEVERGLRGLVGAGPSQVGVSGAMRARDAARPTPADAAAAQDKVVVVRRNYRPPPAPPGGNSGNSRERS